MLVLTDPFWLALAAKMLASATLVLAASLLVERSGPFVGAMIATLPISAGPAYTFLAIEHGAAFVAESTVVSLAVNVATCVFVVTYAVLARRAGLVASLGLAAAVWLALAWVILQLRWSLPAALAANALVYAGAILFTRPLLATGPVRRAERRWWDIPVRVTAAMIVVAVVILCGRLLGPAVAGIAALVPVVFVSLTLVLHPRIGGPAAAAVLLHSLPGMIGLGLAIAVLHVGAVPLGIAPALLLGLATCVAWNLGLTALRWWRSRLAPADAASPTLFADVSRPSA